MTKYISSNGVEGVFDSSKIKKSVSNAMKTGSGVYYPKIANIIAEEADEKFGKKDIVYSRDVDKFVLKKLMDYGQILTANAYERYKTTKHFQNQDGIIDKDVIGIIDGSNQKVISENANKDARMNSTQRDLIAGSESRSYAARKLLPTHILNAHNEGIIHIHDMDYMIHPMFNCQLINLKDMLENGTVINGKMIETPKSFKTACTVATQISLQVANGQYGGQTFSVSHLAKYVRVSYEKYIKQLKETFSNLGIDANEDQIEKEAMYLTRQEIKDGVQTIQFQENTFSSNNGQTPFVSIFMYLNEEPEYIKETAMIIEEMLNLRYLGMKNEYGVYVTPSFPKLLYVLDENNVPKDSEYRYLTDLAVKCSAKRMNPDYISAKVMKQQFDGEVFPCMGCVDKNEIVTYRYKDSVHVETFEEMWNEMSKAYEVKEQTAKDCYYIDLNNVEIYDSTSNGFVECKRIIKNRDKEDWVKIKLSNGRILTCTMDHPLHVYSKGRTQVQDLKLGDKVDCTYFYDERICDKNAMSNNLAWLLGITVSKSHYSKNNIIIDFSQKNEEEICTKFVMALDYESIDYKIKKTGDFYEVTIIGDKLKKDSVFYNSFLNNDNDRNIDNRLFISSKSAQCSFFGGLVDSNGIVYTNNGRCNVMVQTTIKKLALKELLIANTIGNNARIDESKIYVNGKKRIKYIISFEPNHDFIEYVNREKIISKLTKFFEKNTDIETEYSPYGCVVDLKFIGNRNEYSYDVTTSSDRFDVSGIASHNCRSFLTPWKDENGKYKWYGRFNRGVVTINLVDVALSSNGDEEKFWSILDERLELCKEALLIKDHLLREKSANVSPIHWRYGSVARLSENDTIDKYLDGGYSTISLGYIGCYEMCKVMTGESNTSEVGSKFQEKVMKHLEEKTIEWRNIPGLNGASLYGTPSESLTYKFAQKTRNRFGKISGITDKDWFTNSYHINVCEECNAFDKLSFESMYQKMSKGGAVSYVEIPDMNHNLEALSEIIEHMYNTIQYAEVNTTGGDYCAVCGFEGELQIDDESNWVCPQCGNKDKNKLSACRRVCGYLNASMDINKGKMSEFKHRVKHI